MTQKSYLFLVGAPKAGTSSLAAAFAQSGNVSVARIKEPRYFTDFAARDWQGPKADSFVQKIVGDWDTYDSLFDDAPWRMETSTDYLSCAVTPERLARFAEKNPVKIVAVLRDPVARIVSEFQHTLRDGYQTGTLAQSLAAEPDRIAKDWHPLFRHVARSRYAAPIQRYRALFGDDFRVLDFHTLRTQGGGVPAIADFMGIAAPQITQLPHENQSFAPKSQVLNTLMNAQCIVGLARRVMPAGLRGKVRGTAARLNAKPYGPTPDEYAQMRAALADDIAWCIADPHVPTDHWDLARGRPVQPAAQDIMADV